MSAKLQKTIERTREKIESKQFYEAHQAVRTIAARYIRQKAYNDAIEVLYTAAKQLLEAGQPGSGSDLLLYMISVYHTAETPVDNESRARVSQLVQMFDPQEPTLTKIAQETTLWSSKFGESKYGDPRLHHVFGQVFAKAGDVNETEKHLLLGTADSVKVLAGFEFEWFLENDDRTSAGQYIGRAVLGYLSTGNVSAAEGALGAFLEKFNADSSCPDPTEVLNDGAVFVYDSVPLLDFFQLLVLASRKGDKSLFIKLVTKYEPQIRQVQPFGQGIEQVAQVIFGIQPRRQTNILQEMMGSLFS
ncbi:golgi to ER traffic protein 4 [Trichomonascus vanleenenianus]|uniref:protein GET4 n=1 Tax=Trichomonascus vanleenenianus TaxID=2268995 RepID=UPI003ECADFF0